MIVTANAVIWAVVPRGTRGERDHRLSTGTHLSSCVREFLARSSEIFPQSAINQWHDLKCALLLLFYAR